MKMNLRKRFSGQFMIIIVFFISLSFSAASGSIFQIVKTKDYKEQISTLNKQIEATQKEIDKIKDLKYLDDKENLEEIARRKLKMVKPEEIVYIVSK